MKPFIQRAGAAMAGLAGLAGVAVGGLVIADMLGPGDPAGCDTMAEEASAYPDAERISVTVGVAGNTDTVVSETTQAIADAIAGEREPTDVQIVNLGFVNGDRLIEPGGCVGRNLAIGPRWRVAGRIRHGG